MRNARNLLSLVLAGVLALGVVACGSDSGSSGGGGSSGSSKSAGGSLNGAGATFPLPVYQEWAARFKDKTGTAVNYQGIGSGGGIAQFTAGTVDFGATDSAMKDEEIAAAKKKGDPVHVPTVFGAVTVSYNVQGLQKGLKLDGSTVADIFLGKVKTWNDPAIAQQNSGAKLPATKITVCHRSDESGTTKNFTQFLAAYSKAWASGPGSDKSVQWPTGTGAKGNDGVAACIKQNDGAVGYVEQAYALANKFTFASVKNKSGAYVEPTLESTSAAGEGLTVPDDLRFSPIDAPGKAAYPITAATFLLVYQDVCKAGMSSGKAQSLKAWLDYAEGEGQGAAKELYYAALPDAVHTAAMAKVDGLQCNGQPIKSA
ncbi:MAG: phosphate transport system substrate-binding protein [Solirubrobacteraceae bacterium]|jgi:phosphate transport system substrate-binding protein|nr:phosphate transport system substrate-binding protein [Solirubrobacteraceae bacterium]